MCSKSAVPRMLLGLLRTNLQFELTELVSFYPHA
jgi:hypothetical protein